jgi:hypothetical protein
MKLHQLILEDLSHPGEEDFPIIYDLIKSKLEADVEYHIYLPPEEGEPLKEKEVTGISYYASQHLPGGVAVRLGWVIYPKGDRQEAKLRRLFFKPEQLEKWKLTKIGAVDFHLDLGGEEKHASS